MTSTFDQAKIRYLTSQWISTSPVSRHYPRHSFPPIVSFLHPTPPLWSLVRPKLATSGWGSQTGAMLFTQTLPVKNVVLRSWTVVNPVFSEAFWGTWWRQIKAMKSHLSSIFRCSLLHQIHPLFPKHTWASTKSMIPYLSSILNQWQSLWTANPWKWFFATVWILEVENKNQ